MQQVYYPPPGYPQTQPYAYPVPTHTGEGMKYVSWYIAMSLFLNVIGFIYVIIILANPAASLGAACLFGAFALIGFIFFLMAAYKLWIGKEEFGPEHYQNVNRCVLIFVVQFIIAFITVMVVSVLVAMLFLSTHMSTHTLYGGSIVASGAISIITAYLGGLFILYPGKFFMKPEELSKANAARMYLIVGAVVGFFVSIGVASTSLVDSAGVRSVIGYSGAIFTILANYYFYQVYTAISERFARGEYVRPPPQYAGPQIYARQPQPMAAVPPGYAPPPYNPYAPPPPGY